MPNVGLPIGALARESGVKVPTIRYYEGIGLLPAPSRTESNRRLYDREDLQRVTFIRHARELGFDIAAIRDLLDLADQPGRPCEEVDAIAVHHLSDIDHRIEQLDALRTELKRMVTECKGGLICECRIMAVLADHTKCRGEHH